MITFHTAACSLAGLSPVVDPDRTAQLIERQRRLGVRFPDSINEWYAVAGLVEHAAAATDDWVVPFDELGLPYFDDDLLSTGVLLVTVENQDCYRLVIPLDGPADPPVDMIGPEDLEAVDRTRFAPTFSTYAYTVVWDGIVFRSPLQGVAWDVPFGVNELALLRDRMREAPTTGIEDGEVVQRFEGDGGQRAMVVSWRGKARLLISAETAEGYADLVDLFAAYPEIDRQLRVPAP